MFSSKEFMKKTTEEKDKRFRLAVFAFLMYSLGKSDKGHPPNLNYIEEKMALAQLAPYPMAMLHPSIRQHFCDWLKRWGEFENIGCRSCSMKINCVTER